MKRLALSLSGAACLAGAVLWSSPAAAQPGYPPTGPTLGGGTVTTTQGGGGVTLPNNGQDLQTPAVLGMTSFALGVGLLVLSARRRQSARAD